MLKKDQILPIGSLVTVFFKSDGGKETIALIVGHLTMQKHMISRYDYTCVAAPAGIEDGLFYINHSDICSVLHRPSGADYFPENWLERKYPNIRHTTVITIRLNARILIPCGEI